MSSVIDRKILNKIKQYLLTDHIIILTGTRQVGKTTLLHQIETLFKSQARTTLFLDMESPSQLRILNNGVEALLDYISIKGVILKNYSRDNKLILFIDEFQYIDNVNSVFKSLYDIYPQIKIFASGSSSIDIRRKIKESLTGRKRVIKIFPFDFEEVLWIGYENFRDIFSKLSIEKSASFTTVEHFSKIFEDFTLWGGMPGRMLLKDHEMQLEELEEIYHSYIQKDIKGILKNEDISYFNKLISLVAFNCGNLIKINTLASSLNKSPVKIKSDFDILNQTYINYIVPPLYKNKFKEVSKLEKTFFYDNGIRNMIINDFSQLKNRTDSGRLTESAVFTELIKNKNVKQDIFFRRTINQTEIDFVIKQDNQYFPIEVKTGPEKNIPKSFFPFMEEYNVSTGFVLNKHIWKTVKTEKAIIYFLPLFMAGKLPGFISKR